MPVKSIMKLSSVSDGIVISDNTDNITGQCECCMSANANRHPFGTSDSMATRPLALIHVDIGGPLRVRTPSGGRFYVVIMDDYSRHATVHVIKAKGEAWPLVEQYVTEQQTQHRLPVQAVRTDGGSEFKSTRDRPSMHSAASCIK